MTTDGIERRLYKRFARPIALGVVFSVVLAVGGCSSVPDAVNPVEWYKSTVDFITGDEETVEAANAEANSPLVADRGKPPPGADKPFPNLAGVPARPRPTAAEERNRITRGLVADTRARRYSDEVVRRQDQPPPPTPAQPPRATPRPAPAIATPRPAPAIATPRVTAPPRPAPAAAAPVLTPPPARQPAQASSSSARLTEMERIYQSLLAEQRASGGLAGLDAVAPLAGDTGSFETVVISSGGVSVGAGQIPALAAAPVAPVSASSGAGLARTQNRMTLVQGGLRAPPVGGVKVASILFEVGSSQLSSRDKRILGDVSVLHKQRGGKLTVIGHASSRTRNMAVQNHKTVNYKISVDRADAVARELIRRGVPSGSILVGAVADASPLFFEVMPSGEAGNRRTEVYFER